MAENEGGTATLDAPAGESAATATETVTPDVVAAPASADSDGGADAPVGDGPKRGPDGKFLPKETPATEVPKAETDYSSVILPKDATIDSTVLERTVAIARERGLSSEQAQATVDLVNEQVAASRTALLAAHQPGGAEWTKQLDAWKAETLADPSLGKTPDERKAAVALGASVLKQYAAAFPGESQGITAFLDHSGLGEHPAVVKLFRWLGQSAAERPLSTSTDNRATPKTTAEILYPKGADRTEAEVRADP